MDPLAIFNSIEAVFWFVVGGNVWWRSCRSAQFHQLGRFTAIWFVLFGISDIFEVFTGAWYRPLSLLMFKAVCVTVLVSCGIVYRKRMPK